MAARFLRARKKTRLEAGTNQKGKQKTFPQHDALEHWVWILTPPSNSLHQDYYISSRESLYKLKPSFGHRCATVGGRSNIECIFQIQAFQGCPTSGPFRGVFGAHQSLAAPHLK